MKASVSAPHVANQQAPCRNPRRFWFVTSVFAGILSLLVCGIWFALPVLNVWWTGGWTDENWCQNLARDISQDLQHLDEWKIDAFRIDNKEITVGQLMAWNELAKKGDLDKLRKELEQKYTRRELADFVNKLITFTGVDPNELSDDPPANGRP